MLQNPSDDNLREAMGGFRLHRLEVFNWGTFDHVVWNMALVGENALLTGDIGSGKSTLVDALTTLLVPHHRIIFNRAAGAEKRERTLRTYVRGEYKSEQDEYSGKAKAVSLREKGSYTVLLAYFYNEGLRQKVTLAQVFWLKELRNAPEKFFVTAEGELTIAKDFGNFGDDIQNLKRRLRRSSDIEVVDQFKDYSVKFRHFFGIKNEQALNLFYQTVSMKSIGNLTDFVRDHMLEKYDVRSRIETLSRNFDNLNRAHQAVLKARLQIEILTPIVRNARRFSLLEGTKKRQHIGREALESFFASSRAGLLRERIAYLKGELEKLTIRLEKSREVIGELHKLEQDLRESIEKAGGGRIRHIEDEIRRLEREKERKLGKHKEYLYLVRSLGLDEEVGDEQFFENRRHAEELQVETEKRAEGLEQDIVDQKVSVRELEDQERRIIMEIESLTESKNNIPSRSLRIRRDIANTLDLSETELPFIGELLRVNEAELEWEGAIERLLHGFALSLLVPEALYNQVNHYVDRTYLKGRLIYYRVMNEPGLHSVPKTRAGSVIDKLDIRIGNKFSEWLEREIRRRYDFICTDSMDDFHREPRALSINGQVKTGKIRYEKDDRHALHDRSRYVLGWDNKSKIAALRIQLKNLQGERRKIISLLTKLNEERSRLTHLRDRLRDLLSYDSFEELHWAPLAEEIEIWKLEKRELEQSSDVLRQLNEKAVKTRERIRKEEGHKEKLNEVKGQLNAELTSAESTLTISKELTDQISEDRRTRLFNYLTIYRNKVLGGKSLNLRNLELYQSKTREYLQSQIDACQKRLDRLGNNLSRDMNNYQHAFPAETAEMGVDLDALPEYAERLQILKVEDLPRHEARFREMLNKETINSIALFQNQLEKEYQDILDKIGSINLSLREIEYNPGAYIVLLAERAQDSDINEFRESLRQCLSHGLNQDQLYNEQKFLQVKEIIDRFNGREGVAEADRRWTERVTDVRNWFSFSAMERWREDDSDKEYYSDSAGKSGGQKEKLAYTILASALAFQFGLEWNSTQSRSFRFVVIDEAFAKGSDDSTRFGLELFKKLDLQLLIVTPLQKIHVIEDYVYSVHFAQNRSGKKSELQNMTIREYKRKKYEHDGVGPEVDI